MICCVISNLRKLVACFRDKSVSGHSVTVQETVSVCSAEITGATAYEVSGTTIYVYIYLHFLTHFVFFSLALLELDFPCYGIEEFLFIYLS